MKKIVLAFDSFKGSLTSQQVAEAFEEGLRSRLPDCTIKKVSIADGGEGTLQALVSVAGGELLSCRATDPLGRPIVATYGVVGQTAIMDLATTSGLALLQPDERNPLQTTTYGFGQMLLNAIERGYRRFLIGIGGSATNDGGTGLLSALGYRFIDNSGNPLDGCGASLASIVSIDASGRNIHLDNCSFEVACDVVNPLFGEQGAAYVYAPQKGADTAMVTLLDKGLQNYGQLLNYYCGRDISNVPGAGAAGGVGAALAALLNAKMVRGVDMILDAIDFDNIIDGADYVVTGEGRIDEQTMMGKAPYGVLERARSRGVPVIAVGGSVADSVAAGNNAFFKTISATPPGMPLSTAVQPEVAKENIRNAAARLAGIL